MSVADKEAAQQKYVRARARHRFMTRLSLLTIFISGLVLSGLLYFQTTALAPGRTALVIRSGELRQVISNAGHVWRIPILDKVVQVDLQPQPLPTLRHAVTGSDGGRVMVEMRANWQVVSPADYWRLSMAKPEIAARQIEGDLLTALKAGAREFSTPALLQLETRRLLAQEAVARATPLLEPAGLELHEVHVIFAQAIR